MIDCFKVGYWYKWVGSKERPFDWNPLGNMDFLLRDEWFECIETSPYSNYQATFRTGNPTEEKEWSFYDNLEFFIEKEPTDENDNLTFEFY